MAKEGRNQSELDEQAVLRDQASELADAILEMGGEDHFTRRDYMAYTFDPVETYMNNGYRCRKRTMYSEVRGDKYWTNSEAPTLVSEVYEVCQRQN